MAYKRQKNLREHLIRAKLPPPNKFRDPRKNNGMKKCLKSCIICPFIQEGMEIKENTLTWKINQKITCQSNNLVYMIICIKESCKQKNRVQQKYIGKQKES